MQINKGHIFEDPDQDSHVRHLTYQPCLWSPPHGATATPAVVPPGIIPWERPGLQYCAGHPAARICGFDLMILTETNIIDQDYCRSMMVYDVVC